MDFQSQKAGIGTANTEKLGNIAHAPAGHPLVTTYLFGLASPDDTQTRNLEVAETAIALIDGPASEFSRFFLPTLLSNAQKEEIDGFLPVSYEADLINPSLIQSVQYDFQLSPLPDLPLEGDVVWTAEVFGTNGVSTVGIVVQVDANDSTRVSVILEDDVVGDVVLYASYTSTNGSVVFAHPVVVVSRPVGGTLTGITVVPSSLAMGVGATVEPEIWGAYSSGAQSRLYIPINESPQFSSSDIDVVLVSERGMVTAVGIGVATLTASFNNLTNYSVISVLPPGGQPLLRSPSVAGANFAFDLLGRPNGTYRIDASTNLTTWSVLTNITTLNGLWQFAWPSPPNEAQQFFRAIEQ